MLDCCVAAREGHVLQMGDALRNGRGDHQEIATPDCAVGPVAGAVERNTDDRFGKGLLRFGEQRNHMRVVMLNGDDRDAPLCSELPTEPCG